MAPTVTLTSAASAAVTAQLALSVEPQTAQPATIPLRHMIITLVHPVEMACAVPKKRPVATATAVTHDCRFVQNRDETSDCSISAIRNLQRFNLGTNATEVKTYRQVLSAKWENARVRLYFVALVDFSSCDSSQCQMQYMFELASRHIACWHGCCQASGSNRLRLIQLVRQAMQACLFECSFECAGVQWSRIMPRFGRV